jgi:hypothetical protein
LLFDISPDFFFALQMLRFIWILQARKRIIVVFWVSEGEKVGFWAVFLLFSCVKPKTVGFGIGLGSSWNFCLKTWKITNLT